MSPTSLAAETLRVAQEELARRVRETDGPNDSPEIRKYVQNLDPPLDFPIPWCAAFVQWCSDRAAYFTGYRNPLDDVLREAYVDDYYAWAIDNAGLVLLTDMIRPGDLVLFSFGGERYDHIGIAEDATLESVVTIEGNTSDPGDPSNPQAEREGGGLYRKLRDRYLYRSVAIRWAA